MSTGYHNRNVHESFIKAKRHVIASRAAAAKQEYVLKQSLARAIFAEAWDPTCRP